MSILNVTERPLGLGVKCVADEPRKVRTSDAFQQNIQAEVYGRGTISTFFFFNFYYIFQITPLESSLTKFVVSQACTSDVTLVENVDHLFAFNNHAYYCVAHTHDLKIISNKMLSKKSAILSLTRARTESIAREQDNSVRPRLN